MLTPPSPHFTALDLSPRFNADRAGLPPTLRFREWPAWTWGAQTLRGMPFRLGQPGAANVIALDQSDVRLPLNGVRASYLVFLHALEDRLSGEMPSFTDNGNPLGDHVSDYVLDYADGGSVVVPILRRFAIQQMHIRWGASPFEAVPALAPAVYPTPSEAYALGRLPDGVTRVANERTASGRDLSSEMLWLYALPNPNPDRPLQQLLLVPAGECSLVYGLCWTALADHPLRPGLRQKALLDLPPGAALNKLGQYEDLSLDLGNVISADRALHYNAQQWAGRAPDVQPTPSETSVLVEYTAHPAARLHVGNATVYDLSQPNLSGLVPVAAARRPVRLRLVERGSTVPVPARLHLHGAAGEYLPPLGHHRHVSPAWFDDNYAEFLNGCNAYSYVPGECTVELPLGEVFVEATRGYEVRPLRQALTVTPQTEEITLELDRGLDWRAAGWVTADTHVHFLSPQTALLEGAAEGVNVVNLLASQWGEMFSSVGDFDGRTTFGAKDFGGQGEFLVRVGSENRQQVLGHISLLGYDGALIQPLSTGGPDESALGDAQAVAMAHWAAQCIAQHGLVVLPHAPNPQAERAADIVLGLVHAVELMTYNPYQRQLNPFGLADWYRYLNLGYHLPIVGGSDKMTATALLGGIRTYAHLGQRAFTYDHWKEAVRAGNTFATVGPLVSLQVEGQTPGGQVHLPSGGGTPNVTWKVESTSVPIEQIELIAGGQTLETFSAADPYAARGSVQVRLGASTWLALLVRGSTRGQPGQIAAHTSAVQVIVGDAPIFAPLEAGAVLAQIEGTLRYVDVLAARPAAERFAALRATLQAAHRQMHARLHDAAHHP
jgi:hypothetical protein